RFPSPVGRRALFSAASHRTAASIARFPVHRRDYEIKADTGSSGLWLNGIEWRSTEAGMATMSLRAAAERQSRTRR
ncbi:MAG TPA: hypothetical protein VMO47_03655, partial [Rhodothermales bacterium]|nr:hypothetical protein [Rhodothermales bacterium]